MSAPLTNLITKTSLIGVVPHFSANIADNDFVAANDFANKRLKKLLPAALWTRLTEIYNLSTWSNATAYVTGNEVVLNNRGYKALQNGTNKNPANETTYWQEIEIYSVFRDYLKPFLCWQAYNHFLIYHGLFVSQGGIRKHIDLNAEEAPAEERSRAIKRAQETADLLYMDFQKYMDDVSNTIDNVVYTFTDTATFKPRIGIHIVKVFILMLLSVRAYSQYPTPIVNEPKNYHFTKSVYIDGKFKVGYPTPTIARDIHFVADTIRLEGLDGTGTVLGIDVNGDVTRTTVGAAAITGLNQYEVLFGSSGGGLAQSSNLQWSDGFGADVLYITGTSPMVNITEGSYTANLGAQSITMNDGTGASLDLQTGLVRFFDDDAGSIGIYKTDANTGVSYDVYLPAAQGGANTYLKNDGSGNLTWATVSGETNTASNLGGGLANYDSKSGVDLRFNSFNASDFNLASNLISLDYTNGQKATTSTIGFLTDTDWDTFNDKVSFDITGKTLETSLAYNDEIPIYDASEGAINKTTYETVLSASPTNFRNYRFTYFNEFLNTVGTATGGNDIIATNSGTGAGTNNQATDASNRVGLVRSTTGSTATGRTSPGTSSTACAFGGGSWVYEIEINITTLSTVTERYQLVLGFHDIQNAANQTDAIAFVYDEGGVSTGSAASANWQTLTASNTARTFTTTSTAVATGWVNLRIEVNAAGNSVTFYVNGVSVATHTTNIPTGTARVAGFGYLMIKSIGTTARTMDVDYIFCEQDLTTNR